VDVNKVTPPEDDWVDIKVKKAFSRFRTFSSLKLFVDVVGILDSSFLDHAFSSHRCSSSNLVYHGWGTSLVEFFYMYYHVIRDFCVWLPLDEFCMSVLSTLNVAPS